MIQDINNNIQADKDNIRADNNIQVDRNNNTYMSDGYKKYDIEEKVVDYWTKRVADFSDVRENELDSGLSREWVDDIMSYISPLMENGQNLKVLDVGTGVGYFAILLYGKGLQVTGIDLTPDMIERAEVLADRYGADVNFKVMDAMNLEYEDASFDVVITRNLTWTLPDVDKAYKEWHRVLKKGGVLLNYDANYANMKNLDATLIDDDKKEEPYGHQGMTYALEAENAYITKAMDIGRHQRPEYDIALLEKNGFSNCSADKAIGKKLLKEKDIKEAPMFLITAYR